jgi:hypothetical protein
MSNNDNVRVSRGYLENIKKLILFMIPFIPNLMLYTVLIQVNIDYK